MLKKIGYIVLVTFCFVVFNCTNVDAMQGIDVSEWQGYIEYNKVKSEQIEVVYIKSSQGRNITDPYFETNYNNAKENGLKVGFYHFLTARTVDEAREEAEYFCSVISGKNPDCKLAMDFEEFGALSVYEINKIASEFLERVEELTNKEVVIYSDVYNAKNVFSQELKDKYPVWIAEYGVAIPSYAGNWIGFQYTNSGRINGINGYVDRDEFKEDIFLSSTEKIQTTPNNKNEIIIYVVKRGDTLSQIAKEYGTTVGKIAGLNGIRNVNLIYAGENLKIDITKNINSNDNIIYETNHYIYTIKSGDTLSEIARKFGVSVNSIAELNNIKDVNLIYAGERLRIMR